MCLSTHVEQFTHKKKNNTKPSSSNNVSKNVTTSRLSHCLRFADEKKRILYQKPSHSPHIPTQQLRAKTESRNIK